MLVYIYVCDTLVIFCVYIYRSACRIATRETCKFLEKFASDVKLENQTL